MRSSASALRLAGAAILLLASAAPALAGDTGRAPSDNIAADAGAVPAAKPAAKPAKEEKKICRSDSSTGTNLGKKICLTAREWRERANAEY